MSSPAPTQIIQVATPAASPTDPNHWQAILAAIMAIFTANLPLIIHIVPPAVAVGLTAGAILEPVVVQTIVAVQTAGQTVAPVPADEVMNPAFTSH